jgi:biopolymer transport protein ExbD
LASSSSNDEFQITNINVTPLVDIMLVLLIIFLVTATYIVKEAVPIDLPKAASVGESTPHTLQLVITKAGITYVDGKPLGDAEVAQRLRVTAAGKPGDLQVVISADRDTRHGAVVHALDLLRAEGVTKFAIQVERSSDPAAAAP